MPGGAEAAGPPGDGEMAARIDALDWSRTPLGPRAGWSPTLRMMVRFLLANRFPLLLWWGPDYISIYNDAYRPILGTKHPTALGQPVRECWSEIWHILQPLIDTPFRGGPATWMEDIPLEINRHGFIEETHFTIAYSPVPDETAPNGIGGVLATVHEITEKIVGERRVGALRDLGARLTEATRVEQACATAAAVLEDHATDVPFALFYLIEGNGTRARLAGTAGIAPDTAWSPALVALDAPAGAAAWPLADAVTRDAPVVVEDLPARGLPPGPWSDPPRRAVVVPVRSTLAHQLAGVMVAGVSPRLRLDALYRSFFDLVATQVATAIATARAYEEERQRAEALAEIDRAKTEFFSNVSHEFRTPLTLMLGPLEELVGADDRALSPATREKIALAHRSSRRLLKLVNALLDVSRLEAGRGHARYAPTDLAAFTAELASNFRSIVEKVGLRLVVECRPLPAPVHVDRDMWEKIVLNLISNAFKFTFDGEIAISVDAVGGNAVLSVRDTGVGIPDADLPHVFERFHRVEATRGRSYEGSGIGLALVRELVALHGGAIGVESRLGCGTTFRVTLPLGTDHLPADRIVAPDAAAGGEARAAAYVEEAARWLAAAPAGIDGALPLFGGAAGDDTTEAPAPAVRPHVLLAEDNADMRAYVRQCLSAGHDVEAVGDGDAALAAIRRRRPDIVLTDVMMPKLDGFGLLRAVRADPALADLPVVMLSARAGEAASVDGLDAGADDYLVKPFNARELVARLDGTLRLARLRRDAAAREALLRQETGKLQAKFEAVLRQMPAAAVVADVPSGRILFANQQVEAILGHPVLSATGAADEAGPGGFHPDGRRHGAEEHPLARAVIKGEVVRNEEIAYRRGDGREIVLRANAGPVIDGTGRTIAAVATWTDVTDLKHAERVLRRLNQALEQRMEDRTTEMRRTVQQLAESERQLRLLIDAVTDYALFMLDRDGVVTTWNAGAARIKGYAAAEIIGQHFSRFYVEEDRAAGVPQRALARAVEDGRFEMEGWRVRKDGTRFWANVVIDVVRDESGAVIGFAKITRDLSERRAMEERLRQAQKMEAVGQLTGGVAHDFNNLLTAVIPSLEMARDRIDDATALKYLSYATQAAARGAKLTNQLLSFAQKQDLLTRAVDVNQLIGGLCEMLPRTIGPTIDIKTVFDDRLWLATSDANQLELAVLNLAINSRDAMSLGGTLTIRTTNLAADDLGPDLGLERGDYVVVEVADTGVGMTDETRLRAFEPFFTTKAREHGTGLGLAMVYGLARRSGGVATIESAVGTGTTVRLYLPRARATTATTARAEPGGALGAGPSARILVVDDDDAVRDVTMMILQELGHEVVGADSGQQALDVLAADRRFDAMVVDLAMPNMHGAVFAVRAREAGVDLPVLFVTGYTDPHWLRTVPPESLLRKPFSRGDLAAKLRQILGDRRIPGSAA